MVTLISDLDSTLIYSRNPQHKVVEYYQDRPITFMTEKSLNTLYKLLENPQFQLIPCTLRSFEQTTRIQFIQDYLPHFMICDNGYSIYVDGKLDESYQKYLQSKNIINTELIGEIKDLLTKETKTYVKDNRMAFLVVIYADHDSAIYQIDFVKRLVKDYPFTVERQGRKIYVIPKGLDKSVAVQYLMDMHNIEPTYTSGDGFVDEKFVKLGVNSLIPGHAVFNSDKKIKINGIKAGEKILTEIERVVFYE